MTFDSTSYTLSTEQRKMGFEGTEATISDANGNFLMSSNGVWIANANNDTMMNGTGLNPGSQVNGYPHGLLLHYANIFLPFPGDSAKYVLLHHTFDSNQNSYSGFEVFQTIIDLSLDSGLGGVILKNDTILQDTINQGIAACKHANGRDWWIVCQKEMSDILIVMLLTPQGVTNISYKVLGVPIARFNVTQLTFSQDGTQFAYYRYHPVSLDETVILTDFDRCTGLFSNPQVLPVTPGTYLWGLTFSPSGKYLYTCSTQNIFQIDTDSLTIDTVATYDGFCFPNPPWCTTFFMMYLAANGKIYITSGSGVQHIHEINYPDSAGIACDVQQHAINLGVWSFRAVPNHPNYYLECDSTLGCPCLNTSVNEIEQHNFHFSVSPNPNNGNFKISYLLPQNQNGTFEMFDVNGRKIYSQVLPKWSTMQVVKLPFLADGIYNCSILSGEDRVNKNVAVMRK
jgi:WD40 repeat protein